MSQSAEEVKKAITGIDGLLKVLVAPEAAKAAQRARTALQALLARVPADAGGQAQGTWEALPEADRIDIAGDIVAITNELEPLAEPSPLMSSRLAPTWMISLLLLVAIGGILTTLMLIARDWKDLLVGPGSPAEHQAVYAVTKQQAEGATKERVRLDGELAAKQAELDQKKQAQPPDAEGAAELEQAVHGLKKEQEVAASVEANRWQLAADAERKLGPPEEGVIWGVMLFGALGGLLHLAASLTMYVGNRDLKRSWLIYYLMAPLQGAALAPLMYLLMKSAILAPQASQNAQSLNLTGIYALSGLSGLFAKQAIEKLAEIFATFFTKVRGNDPTKTAAGGAG